VGKYWLTKPFSDRRWPWKIW